MSLRPIPGAIILIRIEVPMKHAYIRSASYISMEAHTGVNIFDAIDDAVVFAKEHNVAVNLIFNDTTFHIDKNSNPITIAENYFAARS